MLASVHYQSRAIALLLMMLASMVLEMISIGMVIPALTLLTRGGGFQNKSNLTAMIPVSILELPQRELIILGMVGLGALFFIKTIFSTLLFWWQTRFAFSLQEKISGALFGIYLHQPYTFHLQRNSAKLINTLVTEVNLFTFQVVLSGLILLLECFVFFGVGILLVLIEPRGTLSIAGLAGFSAWLFYWLTREMVSRWGFLRQLHGELRVQHIQQGLSGVKEIKLMGRESNFLKRYHIHNSEGTRIAYLSHAMQQLPRQWLELLAVFILIALIVGMVIQGENSDAIIPTVGLFAVAAFRLLPSITRILSSLQSLRFGLPIVDTLHSEMGLTAPGNFTSIPLPSLSSGIVVKNISYSYPNTSLNALSNISMQINKGSVIGIIGQSGSGKSTLVDIILGLLKPTDGQILVDGIDVEMNLRGWQSQIGYVPQSIYLTDESIRSNIAFGLGENEVDDEKIREAITNAQLGDFISSLPDGLDTLVGERGVRISGGQRQRIGIARALYHNPQILVLDEATSSLDANMAQEVMRSVESMRGKKTILMVAHQIATIENCDLIYLIEDGHLLDFGRFEELYSPGLDGFPVRINR